MQSSFVAAGEQTFRAVALAHFDPFVNSQLAPSTILSPGRDYRGHQRTSVGEELAHNPG